LGSQQGYYICTGDFNGDGIPDLAIVTESLSEPILVALGKGDGTFPTVSNSGWDGGYLSPNDSIFPLTPADFNGDGVSDLAVNPGVTGASVNLTSLQQTTASTSISLGAGNHFIEAVYSGDANFGASTSYFADIEVTGPPTLLNPAPGSQLSGPTVTFTWAPGSGVTAYQLWVGTNWPHGFNIYGSGVTTATSATVTGLPTDGVNVYVTLWYEINGVWSYTPYLYTAAGQTAPPVLTTPTPGSKLSGSSVTFTWTPGSGVTLYHLLVGSYGPGYFNLGGSGDITTTSYTVSGLPMDGRPIYVTLEYEIDGVWGTLNYTYTAAGSVVPPAMMTPTPGSALSGSTVTFNWTPGSGVTLYHLLVGSYGPGYFNIGGSSYITTTSYTVSGIPTNGEPIYVTLLYYTYDGWHTIYYTYTAAP
jgi:FG-GAP-like repeat